MLPWFSFKIATGGAPVSGWRSREDSTASELCIGSRKSPGRTEWKQEFRKRKSATNDRQGSALNRRNQIVYRGIVNIQRFDDGNSKTQNAENFAITILCHVVINASQWQKRKIPQNFGLKILGEAGLYVRAHRVHY